MENQPIGIGGILLNRCSCHRKHLEGKQVWFVRWPTNITLCHNKNTISIQFLHSAKALEERRMIIKHWQKDWEVEWPTLVLFSQNKWNKCCALKLHPIKTAKIFPIRCYFTKRYFCNQFRADLPPIRLVSPSITAASLNHPSVNNQWFPLVYLLGCFATHASVSNALLIDMRLCET